MGGYDIFVATRNDARWNVPQNLGYPLNTTDDDIFFFPIGDGSGSLIPVTVDLTEGRFAAEAFVELKTTGKHPANKSTTHYLKRTWTINTNGITNPVYNITATYANADVAGMESRIAAGTFSGNLPWIKGNAATTAANTISVKEIKTTTLWTKA